MKCCLCRRCMHVRLSARGQWWRRGCRAQRECGRLARICVLSLQAQGLVGVYVSKVCINIGKRQTHMLPPCRRAAVQQVCTPIPVACVRARCLRYWSHQGPSSGAISPASKPFAGGSRSSPVSIAPVTDRSDQDAKPNVPVPKAAVRLVCARLVCARLVGTSQLGSCSYGLVGLSVECARAEGTAKGTGPRPPQSLGRAWDSGPGGMHAAGCVRCLGRVRAVRVAGRRE